MNKSKSKILSELIILTSLVIVGITVSHFWPWFTLLRRKLFEITGNHQVCHDIWIGLLFSSIGFACFALLRLKDLKKTAAELEQTLNEKEQLTADLERNKNSFLRLFQEASDAVIIMDDQEQILAANHKMEKLTGYKLSELLNMKSVDIIDKENLKELPTQIDDLLKKGHLRLERILRTKDGRPLEMDLNISRVAKNQILLIYRDIGEYKRLSREKADLINSLETSLKEIETLSGLLPICSNCKSIRDDKGYWNHLENYIQAHSKAQFTHSLCPGCKDKLYPEISDK